MHKYDIICKNVGEKSVNVKFWGEQETRLLISLFKEHSDSTQKKKDLWQVISRILAENDFYYSAIQVENKWKTLGRAYRRKSKPSKKEQQSPKIKQESCTTNLDQDQTEINIGIFDKTYIDKIKDCDNLNIDKLNDDIDPGTDDEYTSNSLFNQSFSNNKLINETQDRNKFSDLKEFFNRCFDYFEEKEKQNHSNEVKKLKLMEENNRILTERNRLIEERNQIHPILFLHGRYVPGKDV